MSNQEAIASLKTLCHTCELFPKCVNSKPECYQAIEMAISALEAQGLANNSPKLDNNFSQENQKISQGISQGWVPVSRRLPDDLAEVNVTWVNHNPEQYYDFMKDKPATASAVYYKGEWYWYSSVCCDILAEYGKNDTDKVDDAIEITAWQPLPEPYQEESV